MERDNPMLMAMPMPKYTGCGTRPSPSQIGATKADNQSSVKTFMVMHHVSEFSCRTLTVYAICVCLKWSRGSD